jgi:formate hydrogenlyase subunit 6/NADH:ubiquinone oxidoreductase subunit I
MKFITTNNFKNLLDVIQKDYDTYVPVKRGESRFYRSYDPSMQIGEKEASAGADYVVVGEVRAFEPLKLFFTRARERVAEGFSDELPRLSPKPFCVVGAKACDLKGFKVQDNVFKEHDYEDPFYIRAREENLVISSECTMAIDTCFCLALDVKPYPQADFDINVSQVSGGFIAEAGSQKGQALLDGNSSLFEEVKNGVISERDELRTRVIDAVKKNMKQNGIPSQDKFQGIIQQNYDSTIWGDEAKTCVECGACNTICPTCHCFLLYDQKKKDQMERLRVWDSCMVKDFAKVAAGVNPRPWLWMRLRNRFEKKFDFFPTYAGIYACTGCGRCITACPAKIDIRKVLQRLVKDVKKQPV